MAAPMWNRKTQYPYLGALGGDRAASMKNPLAPVIHSRTSRSRSEVVDTFAARLTLRTRWA